MHMEHRAPQAYVSVATGLEHLPLALALAPSPKQVRAGWFGGGGAGQKDP